MTGIVVAAIYTLLIIWATITASSPLVKEARDAPNSTTIQESTFTLTKGDQSCRHVKFTRPAAHGTRNGTAWASMDGDIQGTGNHSEHHATDSAINFPSQTSDQANQVVRNTLWIAIFDNTHEYVRSDPFTMSFNTHPSGPGMILTRTVAYFVCWTSTQPVVVTQYAKKATDTGWHPTSLTRPLGTASGTVPYDPQWADVKIMFDLEVPRLPEGVQLSGSISFNEVVDTSFEGGTASASTY